FGAAGAAFKQDLSGLGTQLGSNLGPAGSALAALGPAGIAAGAGIGALVTAGGGLLAFLADATKGLIETSGNLVALSTQTKLSTDFLQEMAFVGRDVNVDLDSIARASGELSKSIGNDETVFKRLGLDWAQLKKESPEQQFVAVVKAIQALPTVYMQ